MSTVASTPDLPSDPDKLQAEIERRQAHLSQTVSELSVRLAPSTLVAQAKQEATDRVSQAKEEAVGRARAAAYDENGDLRTERLAAVAAAFAAFVSLLVGLKVRKRRRRRARRERELAAAVVVEPRVGRRRYRW